MANESKVAQVGTIDLHSLTNDAHFIYMKDVENVIEEDEGAKTVARIQTAVKALKEAVKEEDERLILSKKSQYTEQIAAKDRERDSIFRGYRTAVKGMLRMPVAKMAEAAADLWQHLKDYNIDPDMQLERETSRMMNLVADLDYKLAPQVQLLGLKPYVDALRAANDTVEELLATRTDDRSQQIAGALRKARLASDEAYLDTVRLINAMAVVGTEKSLTPLINYLNANIKRYKEQVMTRGKKKDDDRPHGRHAYGSGREFIKQNFYQNNKQNENKQFNREAQPLLACPRADDAGMGTGQRNDYRLESRLGKVLRPRGPRRDHAQRQDDR